MKNKEPKHNENRDENIAHAWAAGAIDADHQGNKYRKQTQMGITANQIAPCAEAGRNQERKTKTVF